MDKLPFRQVHLDFHTSECMPDVGSEFSEEDFREALILGHISSITLFAKCHHGWSYFPSHVNKMHPTLKTNLSSNGIVTLMEQKCENRFVNHLLYAVTKLRGEVEVIEDAPQTVNTTVSINMDKAPKRVYLAPENEDIPFEFENGVLTYKVESFVLHTMVVIEK